MTKVKTPPKNSEARINHHRDSGPSSKQYQPADHSLQLPKSKAADSRTAVIERERQPKVGIPFHATPPGLAQELMAIRDSMPGSSTLTQESRLERALRRWPLTTFEMSKWLDLYDPRARIQGLRLAGHQILRSWVWIETDCGQRHRVGRFAMQRGATAAPAPKQSDLFGGAAAAEIDAGEMLP